MKIGQQLSRAIRTHTSNTCEGESQKSALPHSSGTPIPDKPGHRYTITRTTHQNRSSATNVSTALGPPPHAPGTSLATPATPIGTNPPICHDPRTHGHTPLAHTRRSCLTLRLSPRRMTPFHFLTRKNLILSNEFQLILWRVKRTAAR